MPPSFILLPPPHELSSHNNRSVGQSKEWQGHHVCDKKTIKSGFLLAKGERKILVWGGMRWLKWWCLSPLVINNAIALIE